MFLMGVGEQLSAELLRQLAPDEIRRISDEIAAMDSVAPDHMLSVFREFEGLAASGRFFAKGGAECARRLVEQAIGAESARKLLEPPTSPAAQESEAQILQNADPQRLATFLRDENPQTIALVLSNMPAESAGSLMALLPPEIQPQVALRMATLDRISPEVFRRITEAIGSKLKAIRQITRSDGIRFLAELLNRVDGELAEMILTKLEEENQTVATTSASVRDLMFVFDDIAGIDKEGMKALLAKVDRKVLTTALKGTTGKIREHFTQCMSQRAAEIWFQRLLLRGSLPPGRTAHDTLRQPHR